jgi:choline transport protein
MTDLFILIVYLFMQWVAMSASMSVALPSGGPTAVIWGVVVSGIGSLAMAASLAEICSAYPVGESFYFIVF